MVRMIRRSLASASVICAFEFVSPALADDGHPCFGPETINLVEMLVPLPAQASELTKAELTEVKTL